MTDYTKNTNFTAKDNLTSGDPAKLIKGVDYDSEFDEIATASATKANKVGSPTNNNAVKMNATGDLADAGYLDSTISRRGVTNKWSLGAALDDTDVDGSNILTVGSDGNTFSFSGTQQVDEITTVGIGTEIELHHTSVRQFTHDGTKLIVLGEANLNTASGDVSRWKEKASGEWRMTGFAKKDGKAIAASDTATFDAIGGLILSRDAGDTDHDINVTAGKAIDSGNTILMSLSGEITKRIDGTWVLGNDVGGLNDGDTVGNNEWFQVHMLSNADGTSVDVGYDTSITAAGLLADTAVIAAGLTKYRRIGSVLTNGSANIVAFKMYEQGGGAVETIWTTPFEDVDVSNQGTTAIARTLSVPPDISPMAIFNLHHKDGDEGSSFLYVRNPDTTDQAPSSTAVPGTSVGAAAAAFDSFSGNYRLRTNTAKQVETRSTTIGTEVSIWTLGYEDSRR